MLHGRSILLSAVLVLGPVAGSGVANAQDGCRGLPTHAQLRAALIQATIAEGSGLNHQMWGTIVDRDGVVCAGNQNAVL